MIKKDGKLVDKQAPADPVRPDDRQGPAARRAEEAEAATQP